MQNSVFFSCAINSMTISYSYYNQSDPLGKEASNEGCSLCRTTLYLTGDREIVKKASSKGIGILDWSLLVTIDWEENIPIFSTLSRDPSLISLVFDGIGTTGSGVACKHLF